MKNVPTQNNANGAVPDTHLERAIGAALERKPEVAMPADFAARVALRASTLPQRAGRSRAHYARLFALIAAAVLTLVLFAVAPHATPRLADAGFLTEVVVLAELGGIGYWLVKSANSEQ